MELSSPPPVADVRDLGPTPALDGLRGVAILAVLATHVAFLDDGSSRFALRGGYLGVDLFIVLSSFLIGTVLLRSLAGGGLDGVGFARRRLRRLWPALLVFLAVETPVALWFGEEVGRQAAQVGLAVSFTFNWQWSWGEVPPFALVHLWSLAVEAQFYVLLAVGLVLARRHLHRARLVVAVLVCGAVLVALWRWWLASRGVPRGELYVRTDTRADSMLLGLAAAVAWRHRLVPVRAVPVLAAGAAAFLAVCFLVVPVDAAWLYRGGFTVVAAASALVVAGVATGGTWASRAGGIRWLRWVGARSYSLYLWHLPIYIWFVEVVPEAPVQVTAPLAIAASFLVAVASFRWIESRALAPWRAAE